MKCSKYPIEHEQILSLFELHVNEIRNIIVSATIRYFGNGIGSIDEDPGGMTQPDLVEAVYKRDAGSLFNKPAK